MEKTMASNIFLPLSQCHQKASNLSALKKKKERGIVFEKTLCEMEKTMVTNIFSFSHNANKRLLYKCIKKNEGLFWRRLNLDSFKKKMERKVNAIYRKSNSWLRTGHGDVADSAHS